jgi:hypothetical protein
VTVETYDALTTAFLQTAKFEHQVEHSRMNGVGSLGRAECTESSDFSVSSLGGVWRHGPGTIKPVKDTDFRVDWKKVVGSGGKATVYGADKTAIKICIGFCVRSLPARSPSLTVCIATVSQWPGYAPSEHQVELRDQTFARNPIALEGFVKQVGRLTKRFLLVCLSQMWG